MEGKELAMKAGVTLLKVVGVGLGTIASGYMIKKTNEAGREFSGDIERLVKYYIDQKRG